MKKILYAEDNEDTAQAVKMILTNAGFEASVAFSGKECLSKARNEQFDVFLLDIMLSDMSGWDIFQKLRMLNKKIKCIFLSAIPASMERIEELRKAGIVAYITKPFTKADLINNVQKVLGNRP